MSIKETLKKDMVTAMKSGEKLRLSTLRSALGALTDAETGGKARKELDDSEIISVLKKLIKTRRESASIYVEAGAVDRADVEIAEAEVLEAYLPSQLSESDIKALVEKIVEEKELQNAGPRGIGQVMKELKGRDDVDASVASKVAREILQ